MPGGSRCGGGRPRIATIAGRHRRGRRGAITLRGEILVLGRDSACEELTLCRPRDTDDELVMRCHATWFFGADAVGKSVVGWEAYSQLVARGLPAAYVDTDYLGFCDPRPDDPSALVAANLAAVWANYAAQGVRHLVVSGILVTREHRRIFAGALADCSLTTVLLQARADTVRARILRRRQVEAAEQHTTLSETVRHELHAYGDRSAQFAARLEAARFADLSLRTDDRTPAQIATRALDRLLPPAG